MTDIVAPEKRSQMMSKIRSKNTKPEMIVRSWLHRNGYRYRLHGRELPGKPDLVLPKWGTVILVNGCFFHNHPDCRLAYLPKTRTEWWKEKLLNNRKRDARNIEALVALGWKVLVIWECQVRDGSYETVLQNHFREIASLSGKPKGRS